MAAAPHPRPALGHPVLAAPGTAPTSRARENPHAVIKLCTAVAAGLTGAIPGGLGLAAGAVAPLVTGAALPCLLKTPTTFNGLESFIKASAATGCTLLLKALLELPGSPDPGRVGLVLGTGGAVFAATIGGDWLGCTWPGQPSQPAAASHRGMPLPISQAPSEP